MILISFSIALIAIVFGAKLLAQSQKDNLGALYKYLAWFIIAMGFLVLMCDGARGLMRMCHMGNRRMVNKEMMMGRGDGMMGGPMWMMHHRGGNMNCCEGMMNCGGNNNCCNGMMNCGSNNGCSDGSMNCGGDDECSDGKMNCSDGKGMSSSCPMMGKAKIKSDSGESKK